MVLVPGVTRHRQRLGQAEAPAPAFGALGAILGGVVIVSGIIALIAALKSNRRK